MAHIEHAMKAPNNNIANNVSPQPIKEYVVADAQSEAIMQSQAIVTPAVQVEVVQPEISDPMIAAEVKKKRVLEKLLLLKQPHTTQVTIGGMIFTLKILDPESNHKVYSKILKFKADEQLPKTTAMLVAASIVDVDGINLEDTYSGPQEVTDPLLMRYHEIINWPSPLINKLSDAYQEFLKTVEEGYTFDFLAK